MPRYIDADALIKRWSDEHGGAYFLPSEIVSSIEEQPTVDIPERNVGKWIDAKPMSGRVGKVCSACGNEAYWDSDYGQQLFGWCPYCGADMRGGDTDA